GRAWTYAYEGARLASITDPSGGSEAFGYDAAGRLTLQRRGDGAEVAYGYDAAGGLVSVTPSGRGAWRFARDGAGRVTRVSAPPVDGDSAVVAYAYDADGLLERTTRAGGSDVAYAYDMAGRVRTVTMPTGTVRYAYGAATGRLDSIAAPSGTLAFAWDGPLALSATWTGTVAGSVSWSHDADLRVSAERVGGAHEVQLRYDRDGLLVTAGALSLRRDAASGRLTGTTLGAVATEAAYDAHGAPSLTRATAAPAAVLEEAFARDSLGRITRVSEGGAAPVEWGYGYDAAGRLAEVTRNGASFASYEYDANGNRVRVVGPSGGAGAEYDAQDRLVRHGGVAYGWTRDGELRFRAAGADTLWLDYDARGALAAARLADGTRVEYVLDGAGRRIGKRVNGALVQGFLYGGGPNPVAELDGAGAVVARFVYGTRPNVPDYLVRGGRTYALVTDVRGSVRRVVDAATGEVAQAIDYGPWGEVLRDTRPGFQPFGFAGGLADAHTGLLRFGARDYDAGTGRWTARDPSGFGGGDTNLYAYVQGDPVNQIDITGEIPIPLIAAGVWGLVEAGLSAADALSFAQTVADPCASTLDKLGSGGLFAVGMVTPGGGAGAALRYTPDQQALQQIVREATRNGNRQLSPGEAQTVFDWAKEVGYPVRVSPADLAATNNHWVGGPHFHMKNTVNSGHVPVDPTFTPRP
ncbi:MAG TPA: RHS repeat-associated core domain-containing protein, partial [Longimicrobium sp.]|nr:RHS repeat-associated core domain-containing protein [Longimicrobium sp.]